jgi:hypothetical protein
MVKLSQIQFGYQLYITMTNTEQLADGLKSITGLTDQEYEALTAALAKMRTPKAEEFSAHSKMLSAVRNQLQQCLNSNVNDDEKAKLMHDIAELDRKMNAIHQ